MPWPHNEPEHQQSWYWLRWSGIIGSLHIKGKRYQWRLHRDNNNSSVLSLWQGYLTRCIFQRVRLALGTFTCGILGTIILVHNIWIKPMNRIWRSETDRRQSAHVRSSNEVQRSGTHRWHLQRVTPAFRSVAACAVSCLYRSVPGYLAQQWGHICGVTLARAIACGVCSVSRHNLNQCLLNFNEALRNKHQWYFGMSSVGHMKNRYVTRIHY